MAVSTDRLSSYRKQFVSLSTETWLGWGLLLPAGLLMGVIILYPIVDGVLTSFQMRSFLRPEAREFVFMSNYRMLVQDGVFWTALWNSAVLTGVSVALQFLLGLGCAVTQTEGPGDHDLPEHHDGHLGSASYRDRHRL
ncbi:MULTISPECIES: carbohydrate ABC transporter permease [Natrialbaceae]|uniref:carbohydrate ABC transporter permease n=1 Tax=Natrialbaceae TaxID=1644061 RepID=UPI00207D3ADC|nr:hypothetical protein [Natronococcus sp. CG52]